MGTIIINFKVEFELSMGPKGIQAARVTGPNMMPLPSYVEYSYLIAPPISSFPISYMPIITPPIFASQETFFSPREFPWYDSKKREK